MGQFDLSLSPAGGGPLLDLIQCLGGTKADGGARGGASAGDPLRVNNNTFAKYLAEAGYTVGMFGALSCDSNRRMYFRSAR